TLSSADGTHVWKMPVTPYVTFSVMGHNVPLTLELQ
ncbi:conjugal transfer protein TraN, partial [Salmonella enterica]|nr:conjugal transfer protein TraN [Salmonella enterica]